MNQININHIIPNPLKDFGFTESQIWDNQITFNKGEYYQIVAHSGVGKSTLINIIYGDRKDYEGTVTFDNQDITKLKSNNSKLPLILGAALVVSLGVNTYQFIDGKQDRETLDKSIQELSTLSSSKAQLEFDYKNLQDEFTQLKNSIVDNDGLLANKEHNITVQQEEINKILNDANASKESLAKAEAMIKSLKAEISTYKTEIIRLEQENAILVKDNALLTTQRDSIQTNLNTERTERVVERAVAKEKEEELSSTLSISNLVVETI